MKTSRLTYWRRRWCAFWNHPGAPWEPIILSDIDQNGVEHTVKAYRCLIHDTPPWDTSDTEEARRRRSGEVF